MYVVDLEGRELEWKARGKNYLFNKKTSRLHSMTRTILSEKYPTLTILEEVSVPIKKNKALYLDFYLPLIRLAVEVQGEQHFAFNPHFHQTKAQFIKQRKNDREKAEWCELNNINLIELRYDEEEKWKDKI